MQFWDAFDQYLQSGTVIRITFTKIFNALNFVIITQIEYALNFVIVSRIK